jgi:hypothetical protein
MYGGTINRRVGRNGAGDGEGCSFTSKDRSMLLFVVK